VIVGLLPELAVFPSAKSHVKFVMVAFVLGQLIDPSKLTVCPTSGVEGEWVNEANGPALNLKYPNIWPGCC